MTIYPVSQLVAMLNALIAADAPFDGAVCHLFQNDLAVSSGTVLSDLVEATFDNYAPSAPLVWTAAYLDTGDTARVWAGTTEFSMDDVTTPNTVYGWYLTTGVSPSEVLIAVRRLDEPVTMTGPLDAVVVFPTLELQTPR